MGFSLSKEHFISSVGEKVVDKIQSINLKVSKQHLIKKNWVLLKESEEERQIYIFQKDQTLLIANSGDVIKGKWEEVGDNLLMVGSINSIFYFLHKAAEPFNCLEQDNLA